jgi:hypothetical protein
MGKIFRIPLLGTAIGITQDRHGAATKGSAMTAEGQFESELLVKVFDKSGREKAPHEYFGNRKSENKLLGRLHNRGVKAWYFALYRNKTNLSLGSGLTTNAAALATANDWNWPNPATAINVLKACNYHATGTGATAAAATDIQLTTADAITPIAGTQSTISAANVQKLQTVATLSGYGTETVVEWGLFNSATLSATTGTPATASTATSLTATGTPYTASNATTQGQTQKLVVDTTAAPNVYGLVTSNTSSVLSVPAWYKKTDGTAGTTPGATDALALYALMYDHKVFAAINTVTGDTVQFTYQLTIASGN